MVKSGSVSVMFNFKIGPHRNFVLKLHIFLFPMIRGFGHNFRFPESYTDGAGPS